MVGPTRHVEVLLAGRGFGVVDARARCTCFTDSAGEQPEGGVRPVRIRVGLSVWALCHGWLAAPMGRRMGGRVVPDGRQRLCHPRLLPFRWLGVALLRLLALQCALQPALLLALLALVLAMLQVTLLALLLAVYQVQPLA